MAGFTVHPAALDAYANVISANEGSGLDARYLIQNSDYVHRWITCDTGPGLLMQKVHDTTSSVNEGLSVDNLSIENCLILSGQGLTASAGIYRQTEQAVSGNLDRKFKVGTVTALETSVQSGGAQRDPASELTPPSTDGAIPDVVNQILGAAGWLDPGDAVLKIMGLLGFDPVGWLSDRVAGDWDQIAHVKNAIGNLSAFDEVAAADVADGLSSMLTSWSGHAASAAQSYFDQLANALADRALNLAQISAGYNGLLLFIQNSVQPLIEDALSGLLDAAIEAAAAVAAATCVEWIPGVDALADIIGGALVARLLLKVKHVKEVWEDLWGTWQSQTVGIAGATGSLLTSYNIVDHLPTSPYYNPVQGPKPKINNDPGPAPKPGQKVPS